jgi:hypothetical protein
VTSRGNCVRRVAARGMLTDLDLGAAAMSPVPTRRRLALAGVLVALGVLGGGAVAAGASTPSPAATSDDAAEGRAQTPADKAERKASDRAERKASDEAERKAAKAARRAHPTGPAFVCDPALSHGQNVSAYARSLPKGPGRGRLVSQAARSDCGKPSGD